MRKKPCEEPGSKGNPLSIIKVTPDSVIITNFPYSLIRVIHDTIGHQSITEHHTHICTFIYIIQSYRSTYWHVGRGDETREPGEPHAEGNKKLQTAAQTQDQTMDLGALSQQKSTSMCYTFRHIKSIQHTSKTRGKKDGKIIFQYRNRLLQGPKFAMETNCESDHGVGKNPKCQICQNYYGSELLGKKCQLMMKSQ